MITRRPRRNGAWCAASMQTQETGGDLEHALLCLDPGIQRRIRALDLDMDLDLLEIALDVELGLRERAPDLEVALEIVVPGPVAVTPESIARAAIDRRRAAATIRLAPATLDDDWFGGYDEND